MQVIETVLQYGFQFGHGQARKQGKFGQGLPHGFDGQCNELCISGSIV